MKDQEKQKALDEREEAAIESQKEEKRPGCYCKRPCIPLKRPKCSWCCCPGGVTGATGPTGPSGATAALFYAQPPQARMNTGFAQNLKTIKHIYNHT